jgi:hypothetical protein
MSVIIFELDEVIVGVFDNKVDFKNMSFNYIIDHMMSNHNFETKRKCGLSIKDDLKMLNIEENYSFIVKNNNFKKQTLLLNKIKVNISKKPEPKQTSSYKVYNAIDLTKPITLVDISRYITN